MGSNAYDDTTSTNPNQNVPVIDGKVVYYSEIDGKMVQCAATAKDNKLMLASGDESLSVDGNWLHTSISPDILAAKVYLDPQKTTQVPFADIVSALGL